VAFAAPLLRPPAGGLLAQASATCYNLYHCAALPMQNRIAAAIDAFNRLFAQYIKFYS